MASFYEPSGFYKPYALFLIPAAAAVVSTILGILYAVFLCFHPEIFFQIPLLVLWGFLTIQLSKWAIKLGALRGPLKAAILAFIGSLAGYYVHFAFYSALVSGGAIQPGVATFSASLVADSFSLQTFFDLLGSPGALLKDVKEFYIFGVPDREGEGRNEPLLLLLWLVGFILYETLIVVLAYRCSGEPYEEDMMAWLVKEKLRTPFVKLPDDSKEQTAVFNRVAEGDVSYFLTTQPAARLRGSFLGMDIYFYDGAPDACVTVKHHIKTVKRSSCTILVQYLMIPEVQAERLMRHLS